jgi:hypothetical protein
MISEGKERESVKSVEPRSKFPKFWILAKIPISDTVLSFAQKLLFSLPRERLARPT